MSRYSADCRLPLAIRYLAIRYDDRCSSSQQFAQPTRLVAARRDRRAVRSRALRARQEDHAGAKGIAARASARKIPDHRGPGPHIRGDRTDRGAALWPGFGAPSGSDSYWRYKYWLHYAEGSLMPPLLLKLVINRLGLLGRPARPFVNTQLKLHLDFLEGELSEGPWFLGETFSAADIMMSFPLEAARARAGLDETRPNLMDFLKRIHARDAYKRALEKGGAYVYAE
jgi:hypothetical protein